MANDFIQILEGVKRGDANSFESLYDLYAGKVLNYTRKIVANRELAEDITQSCFVKIWEQRASLDPTKSFNSYILTIAKNLLYDEMRKSLLKDRYTHKVVAQSDTYSNETAEEVSLNLLQERVDEVVSEMPTSMRKIYELNSKSGLSAREISQRLSLSPKSVETQILRAKRKLRVNLLPFL